MDSDDETAAQGTPPGSKKSSMTPVELNNLIVALRKTTRRAKVHTIRTLSRQIDRYRKKKGTEKQVEANKKKAERLLEEMKVIKKLDIDWISKFSLYNTSSIQDVTKKRIETKAMVRVVVTKALQAQVQQFRKAHSDWDELASFMVSKTTGRRFKKIKFGPGKLKPAAHLDLQSAVNTSQGRTSQTADNTETDAGDETSGQQRETEDIQGSDETEDNERLKQAEDKLSIERSNVIEDLENSDESEDESSGDESEDNGDTVTDEENAESQLDAEDKVEVPSSPEKLKQKLDKSEPKPPNKGPSSPEKPKPKQTMKPEKQSKGFVVIKKDSEGSEADEENTDSPQDSQESAADEEIPSCPETSREKLDTSEPKTQNKGQSSPAKPTQKLIAKPKNQSKGLMVIKKFNFEDPMETEMAVKQPEESKDVSFLFQNAKEEKVVETGVKDSFFMGSDSDESDNELDAGNYSSDVDSDGEPPNKMQKRGLGSAFTKSLSYKQRPERPSNRGGYDRGFDRGRGRGGFDRGRGRGGFDRGWGREEFSRGRGRGGFDRGRGRGPHHGGDSYRGRFDRDGSGFSGRGRGDSRGSGRFSKDSDRGSRYNNQNPRSSSFGTNDNRTKWEKSDSHKGNKWPVKDTKKDKSAKELHPSWQASLKKKQEQKIIMSFKGKKTVFEDD